MTKLLAPEDVGCHSIFFHHEPGVTIVVDNSGAHFPSFDRLVEIGFLWKPISILEATDQFHESWQFMIASDDGSLDMVWLLARISDLEDDWYVTSKGRLVSPPKSKLNSSKVLTLVEEAIRTPKTRDEPQRNLIIPLITTAIISFSLGLLGSLVF